MSERKKILWLTSWYPNDKDVFDGDFIQRHARAAAIFHDIHVIYITEGDGEEKEDLGLATGLTEQIIYLRKQKGIFSKFLRHRKWMNVFRKAIDQYMNQQGRPDLVHIHIAWKAGLAGMWLKKKYNLPYILSEHWGIFNATTEDNFSKRSLPVQKLIREIYKEAWKIISVSHYLGEGIKNTTGRSFDTIIPNVVDTTLFFQKDEKYSKFSFIHVSNMVPLKNAGSILKAFHQMANEHMQLIMIGNRDDRYVKLAAELGMLNQSVFFRGEIPYTEVAAEMRRCHCMVIYSDSETFSCVTAEALCAGLPVIAANTGALPELVNSDNGILVPLNDVDSLAESMRKISGSIEDYDSHAIAGSATRRYSYAAVSDAFKRLYNH